MARIVPSSDLASYIMSLQQLEGQTRSIMGAAVYEGAKVVTDEIRKSIQGVRIRGNGKSAGPVSGLTSAQRIGLLAGLGVASMRNDNGFLNVKIGFDGYNRTFTKRFPKGQPNVLVARALEKGTDWHAREPVISQAARRSKPAAIAAMEEELDRQVKAAKGDY